MSTPVDNQFEGVAIETWMEHMAVYRTTSVVMLLVVLKNPFEDHVVLSDVFEHEGYVLDVLDTGDK